MTTPEFPEYHKIYGPFRRETEGLNRNKVIPGAWTTPELEYLAGLEWVWTEKVDGTNIRIAWDGHKVTFGGRTANAQIPARLVAALQNLFPEELFEQVFGGQPAVLFGEGYGAGIQKAGSNYRPDPSFVLFDVRVDEWWLRRADVEQIAGELGIAVVPIKLRGNVHEAIELVRSGVQSDWGEFPAEGLVGTPAVPLFSRSGSRIIIKVKRADFQ